MRDAKFRAIRNRITTAVSGLTLLVSEVYFSSWFSVNKDTDVVMLLIREGSRLYSYLLIGAKSLP